MYLLTDWNFLFLETLYSPQTPAEFTNGGDETSPEEDHHKTQRQSWTRRSTKTPRKTSSNMAKSFMENLEVNGNKDSA